MGITYNGIHSDTFQIAVSIKSLPYLPKKRQTTIEVQGRDGGVVFEDSYDNINIELSCQIGGYEPSLRRSAARKIAAWLSATGGQLIFDYEPDKVYTVVAIVNDVSSSIDGWIENFTINFTCKPYQTSLIYNDELTWNDANFPWNDANFPWLGYSRIFTDVRNGDILSVGNAGTYKALPVVKLDGVAATVTIGSMTYSNLAGIIYIDCEEQVVYSISGAKVNQILNFSGEFIEILPGVNNIIVSGSITSLNVEFDYKNTFI